MRFAARPSIYCFHFAGIRLECAAFFRSHPVHHKYISPKTHLRTSAQAGAFMRWLVGFSLFVATTLSAGRSPFAGQVQKGAPQLAFTDTTIAVSGLGPNSSVTIAGFVIDTHDYTRTITTPAYYQRSDQKGDLTVTIPGGVKPRSVWILVTHDGYTVASPLGVLTTFDLPENSLTFDKNNQLSSVFVPRSHTEVFSIPRPPGGGQPDPVVVIDAKDGSPTDADNTINGTTSVSVVAKPGDTLFVVDTRSLECSAAGVNQ